MNKRMNCGGLVLAFSDSTMLSHQLGLNNGEPSTMSGRILEKMRVGSLILIVCGMTAASTACGEAQEGRAAEAALQARDAGTQSQAAARAPLTAEETAFYQDAARLAWRFMDANYRPSTGFVSATRDWDNTTVWDIGGQLLAFLAAKELGLLNQTEFDRRTRKALETLTRAQLYDGAAYNKTYSTKTGAPGEGGLHGWSATDLGRLLVGLKVIAVREPHLAQLAERVVRRMDFDEIVKDGYLYGRIKGNSGRPWTFQEGRIGYEQYTAHGFDAWGIPVANALNLRANAEPVTVLGVPLLADKRWQDRLVSEPFILLGLELGMPSDVAELASNMLRLQEDRFKTTGQITITSEDALDVAPHYFFYYCVYCNRKPFVIDLSTPGKEMDSPRWVSTKGAFGWHALMPTSYTKRALDLVATARDSNRGWSSGVYERTNASTKTYDINTAAVILEVAAYQLRGRRPQIQRTNAPGS